MRFALLGNDPDGVAMACALVDSGRHRLAAYTAPVGEEVVRRWGPDARRVADVEEILADPAVEAVLVAGSPTARPEQLRRALQSERHVLSVFPPDATPEVAYEAAMIQNDTGYVLLPLLPEALHPGVRRLAEFVRRREEGPGSPVGTFRLLEAERVATGEVLDGVRAEGRKPTFPGWDVLRTLGGEIQEVSAFADRDELRPGEPVLVAGRFEQGGVFQETLLPDQPASRWRLAVVGTRGRAELLFPVGWHGPAFLDYIDEAGERREEAWDTWDPWPVLVNRFEAAVAPGRSPAPRPPVAESLREAVTAVVAPLVSDPDLEEEGSRPAPVPAGQFPAWQDAIRALELDDAARRSVERRRASLLEYPEATEEAGFKGTMTLVGCALLWIIPLLLIASKWVPWLFWLVPPVLVVFLLMQFLRYLIPGPRGR